MALDNNQIINFEFQIDRLEQAHFHSSVEILYVLEGDPKILVSEHTYQAHAEDIIVINANKKHGYQSSADVLIGCFEIDYGRLQELLGNTRMLFWCNSVTNKNTAYDDMRQVMKQIFVQYFEREGSGGILLQSLYYRLLQILVESFMVAGEDFGSGEEQSQEENRMIKIVDYIQANYKKKMSLSTLAEHFYLSVPYLSKYIKKNLGMNYVEYVNSIRLFHAVDDLLNTNHSIIVIALENGFSSTAAFNETFKKAYGMTPSEYRQSMCRDEKNGETSGRHCELVKQRVTNYLEGNSQEAAQEQKESNEVEVDVSEKKSYSKYWKHMINAGRAGDMLRSDMQEQVLLMKQELGFRYVRIWDIFGEEMLLNETSADGQYHFDLLDKVFDFFVENGICLYLEMGYKPKEIYRALNKDVVREKRRAPFADGKSYERFLDAFVVHLINRYGLDEVEKWYFEQWSGEDFDVQRNDTHFFDNFALLYKILKQHSGEIHVGGGGIGIQYDGGNLEAFVEAWSEQPYKPDFLSLYCYPYIRGDEDGIAYARQSSDREFLKNQLETAESKIRRSGLKDVAVHVSEWSSTISNRSMLNDSCYKGAYIMKSIIDSFGKAEVLGYWGVSDIFSEYTDCSRPLFGGCGLVNVQGIKKPAYYAYDFLNNLGRYFLHRGSNDIVTTNGNNNYSIVCHNYRHLNYRYYLQAEDELEKLNLLYEDNNSAELTFRMLHVKDGKYKIKTYSINSEYGSIQEEWERIGEADVLSKQEVNYLKRICTPRIQIHRAEASDGVLEFTTQMKAQEIQYIHVSYQYE